MASLVSMASVTTSTKEKANENEVPMCSLPQAV
jgi:hypothetical protein